MLPALGLLTWLAVWTRQRELRTVAGELPAYAAAGWLSADEPPALSSMRARSLARSYAARTFGPAAARSVGEYEAFATSLAFLRHRARRGWPTRTSPRGSRSCCTTCGSGRRWPPRP